MQGLGSLLPAWEVVRMGRRDTGNFSGRLVK